MIRKITFLLIGIISTLSIQAQLTINGAQFFIEAGAVVTVQGDVTSNTDILGPGKILLKGSANQNVNMNGFTIPVLEIDNAASATLTGNTRIGTSLLFTNGKIKTDNFNLTLANVTTITGAGTGKFFETNGTGQVFKEVTANLTLSEIPVGSGFNYRPAFLTTSGTYSSAKIGVKLLAVPDPNKPPKISDFISAYWPVTKTGITGTVTVTGQYIDAGDITGAEANLRGYFFNGTDWSSTSGTNSTATNRISAIITTASGNLSAMDKFDLLRAKVFLQGAYNSTTGVMSDALRTPSNIIPLSDPYRTPPYAAKFSHVLNTIPEVAVASVFSNQASSNNDIVDWVFLELRNTIVNPGANILETRSALLQRDGDIVDIDGTSLVTFNNVPSAANYTIAVRHRNHLGISTDPVSFLRSLNEQKSTAVLTDFTTASDATLFGTSAAFATATDGKIILWGGNASINDKTAYVNPGNDKDYILSAGLGGVASGTTNGYNESDINFTRTVKYVNPGNDKDYLLSTILNGVSTTSKTQSLPQ